MNFRHSSTVLVAVATLAVIWLAVARWDDERPLETAPVPKQSFLAPPGYSLDAPAQPPPAWDSSTARNSTDLYASFESSKKQGPVGMLVALSILGGCTNATASGDRMTRELGDYNSTKAGAPERNAKLASLERQKTALAELQRRCKGFHGYDPAKTRAEHDELRAAIQASDSVLGRLLRAQAAAHEGDTQEWLPAVTAALASGDPVVTRMALYGFAQSLYQPKTPEPFSAFGALLLAHAKIAGDDRNELETLAVCASAGWCDLPNSATPLPADWSAQDKARFESLVTQYEQALRANDVKAILAVKPG